MAESALNRTGYTEVPYNRVRAATARRMTHSVTTKPQVTLHSSARVKRLLEIREQFSAPPQPRLTLTHLLARVTVHALATKSMVNGWVQDDVIRLVPVVNLGIAVQTERGLVTPVLPDADRLPFQEFAARVNELIQRARGNKLHPRELADGTFTMSNLGTNFVGHFTPIVNPPQLAVLGIGRVRTAPAWDGSAWQAVPEVPLSLTIDHAAVDGQPAAAFLDHLIATIEEPPDTLWG
jgi:pyruvate dehydrogenase E2 component (dihydrolipoamide acetyltransferase)